MPRNCLQIARSDNFAPAVRDMERPFRLSISDVYKDSNQSGGVTIAGKIEAGVISTGDKVGNAWHGTYLTILIQML